MPSFILRNLDAEFWGKVQAKAKAEGASVKSVILRLLAAWLGVCCAALVTACGDMAVSPVAPSASTVVIVQPAPVPPVPSDVPFRIDITDNGGQTYTDTPFHTSVIVSGGADPRQVNVNCNNGTDVQAYPGARGIRTITCLFQTEGVYPIVATAIGTDGFTATARTDVTASVRPVPPPPPPPPAPVPPPARSLLLSETCTVKVAVVSCNVAGTLSDGQAVTTGLSNIKWDLGDGSERRTSAPAIQYTYGQAGTYRVIVSASYQGVNGQTEQTVTVP